VPCNTKTKNTKLSHGAEDWPLKVTEDTQTVPDCLAPSVNFIIADKVDAPRAALGHFNKYTFHIRALLIYYLIISSR
jgi:hypothetical protein